MRKVGTTSSHHGPYVLGYTRATMAGTMSSYLAIRRKSQKACLSSDRSLQLDFVKLESLVIGYQQWSGEYVPGPCTHRPSSHGSWENLKSITERSRLGLYWWLGLSRNKVAVSEGAAGPPPFWSKIILSSLFLLLQFLRSYYYPKNELMVHTIRAKD